MSATVTPEATRTATVASLVSIFVLVFSIPAFGLGIWSVAIVDIVFAALYFVPVVLAQQLGRPFLAANFLCATGCLHIGIVVAATNGLGGLSIVTVLLVPACATLTMSPRMGWIWLVIAMGVLAVIHGSALHRAFDSVVVSPWSRGWVAIGMLATTGALVQAAVASFASERLKAEAALDETLQSLEDRVITRTAELELEVEQRRAAEHRAAQANHAKTSFLMNMSHELRTPLNAIQGYAELVGEELGDVSGVPDHLRRDLDQITAASAHLLGLIDNILEYARVEAGQIEIHPTELEVAPLVEECARLLQPVLANRNNRLELRLDSAGSMWADPARVRQILINLVSNASKFTETGCVTLAAGIDGDTAWIEVHDEGPGIEPELLPRVFERFTRGSEVHVPGTGLGLAISHDLASRMGGRLEVRSTLGEGSTFRLALPARPPS